MIIKKIFLIILINSCYLPVFAGPSVSSSTVQTLTPSLAIEILENIKNRPPPIFPPTSPLFASILYGYYEEERNANLSVDVKGNHSELDLLELSFTLSQEAQSRERPQPYSVYGLVEFMDGIPIPLVFIPDEFRQSPIHFLVFIHEAEHVIQLNRLIWGSNANSIDQEFTENILIAEESAILAEWIFIRSLPDEAIENAKNLVLAYSWKPEDTPVRESLLRALDANKFEKPEDFLNHERQPGRRLDPESPLFRTYNYLGTTPITPVIEQENVKRTCQSIVE